MRFLIFASSIGSNILRTQPWKIIIVAARHTEDLIDEKPLRQHVDRQQSGIDSLNNVGGNIKYPKIHMKDANMHFYLPQN